MTEKTPQPCVHSVTQSDCVSCWHGSYRRMVNEYLRLREVVMDYGDRNVIEAMKAHEGYRFGANAPENWRTDV